MDLLASTGNETAQNVMLNLLSNNNMSNTEEFDMLLQRFSFVQNPTENTMSFINKIYLEKKENIENKSKYAAAYSLGAAVWNLFDSGNKETATHYNEILLDDLKNSNTTFNTEKLIRSIGNAGMESNIDIISKYTNDENAEIRAATALSLRKTQTEESEKLLLDLVKDKNVNVQQSAIRSFLDYKSNPNILTQLNELISIQAIDKSIYPDIVSLVTKDLTYKNEVKSILQSILIKNPGDKKLKSRIRGLINTFNRQR